MEVFKVYLFQSKGLGKSPVLFFFVITSPCRKWVSCAPAAFTGCGRLILALELPQFSNWDRSMLGILNDLMSHWLFQRGTV